MPRHGGLVREVDLPQAILNWRLAGDLVTTPRTPRGDVHFRLAYFIDDVGRYRVLASSDTSDVSQSSINSVRTFTAAHFFPSNGVNTFQFVDSMASVDGRIWFLGAQTASARIFAKPFATVLNDTNNWTDKSANVTGVISGTSRCRLFRKARKGKYYFFVGWRLDSPFGMRVFRADIATALTTGFANMTTTLASAGVNANPIAYAVSDDGVRHVLLLSNDTCWGSTDGGVTFVSVGIVNSSTTGLRDVVWSEKFQRFIICASDMVGYLNAAQSSFTTTQINTIFTTFGMAAATQFRTFERVSDDGKIILGITGWDEPQIFATYDGGISFRYIASMNKPSFTGSAETNLSILNDRSRISLYQMRLGAVSDNYAIFTSGMIQQVRRYEIESPILA